MKNHRPTFLSLSLLVTAVAGGIAFSGCTKTDRKDAGATVKDAYDDSKMAMSKAWADVKDYSYDKRSDFTAGAKAATSRMDAEISRMRANYSEAKASASRKAAMAELKNSEADYKDKLSALGSATADTWDSAKKNVSLAWDRMEAAYYKARAD
ncbi:MAG: hypothetical protein ABIQ12_05800 [Opitutaceae bacterium]